MTAAIRNAPLRITTCSSPARTSLFQALMHDETGAGSHSLKNGQLSLTRWNTLMAMMFAPGATPLGATDGPLAPAAMPATCVPWKQPLSPGRSWFRSRGR